MDGGMKWVRQEQGLKCLKWLREFATILRYPSETLTHDATAMLFDSARRMREKGVGVLRKQHNNIKDETSVCLVLCSQSECEATLLSDNRRRNQMRLIHSLPGRVHHAT